MKQEHKLRPTPLHKLYNRDNINGPFIIADLGLTNGGSLKTAINLIEVAADLGVDAVKFQMLCADELINNKDVEYTYPTILRGPITENMVHMFKGLEFTDEQWHKIKTVCDRLNVGLIVTSHVESAVPRINSLNLPVNKICTWSISHWRMIEQLAKNGKPLIIDTGTITENELLELENFYKSSGGGDIIILFDLHTTDLYDRNFSAIKSLVNAGYCVGYTPQGRDDWLDFMSIGMGVTILEKRLTLSRVRPKNGHWKAHEPSEFEKWLSHVRDCASAVGESKLTPTKADILSSKSWYKSAFLAKNVSAGQEISNNDFLFQRPGHGISSKEIYMQWLGKKYVRSYSAGDLFQG